MLLTVEQTRSQNEKEKQEEVKQKVFFLLSAIGKV